MILVSIVALAVFLRPSSIGIFLAELCLVFLSAISQAWDFSKGRISDDTLVRDHLPLLQLLVEKRKISFDTAVLGKLVEIMPDGRCFL